MKSHSFRTGIDKIALLSMLTDLLDQIERGAEREVLLRTVSEYRAILNRETAPTAPPAPARSGVFNLTVAEVNRLGRGPRRRKT